MEFCVLGPLVVRRDGVVIPVPQGMQRAVLAALLLNANRVVSLDDLAEVLWGHTPPPSARVTVQNYVMRLRKALSDADGSRIVTQARGYLIKAGPRELDFARFAAHMEAARAAARGGSWDQALVAAQEALALWRDDPLTDVGSETLAAQQTRRLTEMRLQALEIRIDAALHLGLHKDVISELRHLAECHPLREYLHGQLMLALYHDGRQAEALAVYQHVRRVLIDELGTEPAAELRELHQQMLTADPALAIKAKPAAPETGPGPIVPRELPAQVRHFSGRAVELAMLTHLLNQDEQEATATVVVTAIGGTAGVGKTALAVHWAHQVSGRFPDGQLYVNLRGYDPGGQPMPPADALSGFLRALGVPDQDIPVQETERAARYRSLLAGRRILVVLDNARYEDQVRPLLPGTPACTVVVTSRDALPGLVARDGAVRVGVDLLPQEDAVSLLRALIGRRADDDLHAAKRLAGLCCRLPLALRIAAELASSHPDMPLTALADELADQQARLELLQAGGDPRTAIRAVFSWSYRYLDPGAARAFRLLGLHPGADIESFAAGALTGATPSQARQLLDLLARAHLIQPAGQGRYSMYDLLRVYAQELAAAHDAEHERQAALTRLFDHYRHTTGTAIEVLFPTERPRQPRPAGSQGAAGPFPDAAAARLWLDAERSNLAAVTEHAARHGWPTHATQLAAALFRYLESGSYSTQALIIHSSARSAARQIGDHNAEATALNHLAGIYWHQGRYHEVTGHLHQALALYKQTGCTTGQATALSNLGVMSYSQGQYQIAATLSSQAVELYRQIGDRIGESRVLANLGDIETRQGLYQQAVQHHQQSLAIARKTDDQHMECVALLYLGTATMRQGHFRQAASYLRQALSLSSRLGHRNRQADALTRTGELHLRQSRPKEAASQLELALALYRETGERAGEADALNGLGQALLAAGQPCEARREHHAAHDLASQITDIYQQARAHDGLGDTFYADGDQDQARGHWQQALSIYTELGTPESGHVQAQLTRIRPEPSAHPPPSGM